MTENEEHTAKEEARLGAAFDQLTRQELGLETPANIVVAGLTGVGKSTLINAVFGADFCQTAIGAPVTQGVDRIATPDIPVVLYDTRGLEVESSRATLDALTTLLRDLRASTNPAEQPHALWLCINTGADRVESVHERLASMALTLDLPMVVVLTQDYYGDSEILAETVRSVVSNNTPIIPVVAGPYAAKNGRAIRPRGLEQLVAATAAALPASARAALDHAQIANLERRKAQANAITNRAAALAAGTAFPASFAPMSHSAVLAIIETHMLKSINKALGLQVPARESRALTLGLAGVAAAAVGGPVLATQLATLIPGVGQITSATAGAMVAAGIVKALGAAYTETVAIMISQGQLNPTVEALVDLFGEQLIGTLHQLKLKRV